MGDIHFRSVMTHASVPPEQRAAIGISDSLVSVFSYKHVYFKRVHTRIVYPTVF